MFPLYHLIQLPLFSSKVCSKCTKEKFLDEFPVRKESKDGYRADCQDCVREQRRIHYAANRERLLQEKHEYTITHREQIKQRNKAYQNTYHEKIRQQRQEYRNAHREHAKQKSKEWHATHKEYAHQRRLTYYTLHQEQLQQHSREYYHENKDRIYYAHHEQKRQQRREYYATHREQYKQRQQEYRISHQEQRQQWTRNYIISHREQYRQASRRREAIKRNTSVGAVSYKFILARDGYVCHICGGIINPKDLHFDHVIPLSRGGPHTQDNIKPAHSTCNIRKHNKLMEELTPFQRRGMS